MTQQQIEGNKIIAEFDGWVCYFSLKGQHSKTPLWNNSGKGCFAFDLISMKYHSSWDWIIPAVNKFTKSAAPTDSWDYYKYKEYCDRLKKLVTDFNIIPVFNCLSEAIKWYNQQH